MTTSEYDYEHYGTFKTQNARPKGPGARLARSLGLRNRYLRFLRDADRRLPVVEIGCGDGSFLDILRHAGFSTVKGYDLSTTYAPRIDVEYLDAVAGLERAAEASLGCVIAFDLFEHLPLKDLRHLLSVAKTRLAPGGRLVFRVPNMASPLALFNQFGDNSHVTTFNEVSIVQLAFEVGLEIDGIHAEPRAYPQSIRQICGAFVWPIYREITKTALATFGVRTRVLTPNLICVLKVTATSRRGYDTPHT